MIIRGMVFENKRPPMLTQKAFAIVKSVLKQPREFRD
jgi:hypothetical protein